LRPALPSILKPTGMLASPALGVPVSS